MIAGLWPFVTIAAAALTLMLPFPDGLAVFGWPALGFDLAWVDDDLGTDAASGRALDQFLRICRRCGGLSCLWWICQTEVVLLTGVEIRPTLSA